MKYMVFGLEFIFISLFFLVLVFTVALLAPEPTCQTDMECVEMFGHE